MVKMTQKKEEKTQKQPEVESEEKETTNNKLQTKMSFNIWKVISVIIAIGMLVLAYFTYNLQQENMQLSKPYIIRTGLIVRSGVENVNFPFYIRNPSNNEYTIDLIQSSCGFETKAIHRFIPKETATTKNTTINIPENLGSEVIFNPGIITILPLTPRNQTELLCSGFSVDKLVNDMNSFMNICIKIIGIKDLICEKIPLTIAKTSVVS
jgi:hypothetical protein